MKRTKRTDNKNGLSFLEIFLISMIVTVLAMVVVPQIGKMRERTQVQKAQQELERIREALKDYQRTMGSLPSTREGLRALIDDLQNGEERKGPFLYEREVPSDPWGQYYVYRRPVDPNIDFLLFSLGPDGREGTKDDVSA